ncbi:MAG: hypothetical protein AAB787_01640 [Patescibacteria group bacterium]|mgnify:CR=1 FL=1
MNKKPQEDTANLRWVCDYGTRHLMHEGIYTDNFGDKAWSGAKCSCVKKFGVPHEEFISWCYKYYGIAFPHLVKTHMQEEFLRVNSLTSIF